MGNETVENRANQLIESQESDAEEYWDGEQETVRELLEEHEVEA
jgi:hypothetical protein